MGRINAAPPSEQLKGHSWGRMAGLLLARQTDPLAGTWHGSPDTAATVRDPKSIAYKGLIPDLQTSPSLQTVTGSFSSQQSQVTITLSLADFQMGEKL